MDILVKLVDLSMGELAAACVAKQYGDDVLCD